MVQTVDSAYDTARTFASRFLFVLQRGERTEETLRPGGLGRFRGGRMHDTPVRRCMPLAG